MEVNIVDILSVGFEELYRINGHISYNMLSLDLVAWNGWEVNGICCSQEKGGRTLDVLTII